MPTTLTDVPLPGRVVAYAKLPCVICPGRSTNFCRPLEEQLQAELFHTVARQRWEPREFLFRRGDPAGPLFKITEGIASVSHSLPDGRRQILRFLLPGDVCGYLEENGRYSFDGQAVSEVITCSFPRKDFQHFEKHNNAFAEAVRTELSDVLAEVSLHVTAVGNLTAVQRLAVFLVAIGKLFQARGMQSLPLKLPMTRTDIAEYLGMRPETLSRRFTAIERRGFIAINGEQVSVTNLEGLKALGERHLGGGALRE